MASTEGEAPAAAAPAVSVAPPEGGGGEQSNGDQPTLKPAASSQKLVDATPADGNGGAAVGDVTDLPAMEVPAAGAPPGANNSSGPTPPPAALVVPGAIPGPGGVPGAPGGSARGSGASLAPVSLGPKSQYLRSPFLDERYQQNKLSVSPFSSTKRHLVRTEKVLPPVSIAIHKPTANEQEYMKKYNIAPFFSCKMTYPYTLVSQAALPGDQADKKRAMMEDDTMGSGAGGAGGASGDSDYIYTTGEDEAEDSGTSGAGPTTQTNNAEDKTQNGAETAEVTPDLTTSIASMFATRPLPPQPNPYWQQPPPTFNPLPNNVMPQPMLKKDEWHPWLATSTAAQTALNMALQGEAPATAPANMAMSFVKSPSTMKIDPAQPGATEGAGQANPTEPTSLTLKAALLLSKSIYAPLQPHTIPANAAFSANKLQPAVNPAVQFVQTHRLTSDIHANNNFHNTTFHDRKNIVIPPPVAFRNVSPAMRHILQARGPKARAKLEHELMQTNPIVVPPPRPLKPPPPVDPKAEAKEGEEGAEGGEEGDAASDFNKDEDSITKEEDKASASQPTPPPPLAASTAGSASLRKEGSKKEAKAKAKTEVKYNPLTGEIEIVAGGDDDDDDEEENEEEVESEHDEEWEYSLEACLGPESRLRLWNTCVDTKCEKENALVDPTYSPSPVDEVVGKRRSKVLTSNLTSTFTTNIRKAGIQRYLCGTGLRMGSILSVVMPPSTSSFTTQLPQYLRDAMGGGSGDQKPGPTSGSASPQLGASMSASMSGGGGGGGGGGGAGQFGGAGPTPSIAFACSDDPNSYAYKDHNLSAVICEKGGEIEEINMESMSWISPASMMKIGDYCPNLKLLNLCGCSQLTNKALIHIAENCHLLAYVNIAGCTNVTGDAVSKLIDKCGQLQVLILRELGAIDAENGVAFFNLHRARTLRALDLSYCTTLTDQALLAVAEYCPSLEFLDVSGCRSLGDLGFSAVGGRLSNLSTFVCKLCSQKTLTPAGLSSICRAPRNLKRLDVSGCTQMDDATLSTILRHTPCMKALSIGGCKQITDASILTLNTYCKQLQKLNISGCTNLSLQVLLDLIHDVPTLVRLAVSESKISNAEVKMLSEVRARCQIVKNQYRAPQKMKDRVFKPPEDKKKKKPAPKDDKKGKGKK